MIRVTATESYMKRRALDEAGLEWDDQSDQKGARLSCICRAQRRISECGLPRIVFLSTGCSRATHTG
jgi:hypothetical protein